MLFYEDSVSKLPAMIGSAAKKIVLEAFSLINSAETSLSQTKLTSLTPEDEISSMKNSENISFGRN